MLSLTGRTQAFSLGESFAEHYGFTLLDNKGNYTVEFAGILSLAKVDKVNIESRRRRVGLRWVSGESIIQTRSNLNPFRKQRVSLWKYGLIRDAGARSLQQYKSCPNFSDGEVENNKDKVGALRLS